MPVKNVPCPICGKEINYYMRERHYATTVCKQAAAKKEQTRLETITLAEQADALRLKNQELEEKLLELEAKLGEVTQRSNLELALLEERLGEARRQFRESELKRDKLVGQVALLQDKLKHVLHPFDRDEIVFVVTQTTIGDIESRRDEFLKTGIDFGWTGGRVTCNMTDLVVNKTYLVSCNRAERVLGYITFPGGEVHRDSNHSMMEQLIVAYKEVAGNIYVYVTQNELWFGRRGTGFTFEQAVGLICGPQIPVLRKDVPSRVRSSTEITQLAITT